MRIVVTGPPSVGKSTQCSALAAELGIPHVSSGALIRSLAAAGDPDGRRLADIVADGSLAPSDEIVAMVLRRLRGHDCRDGFVLDGFPRRVEEAAALLADPDLRPDVLVRLEAPPAVLRDRRAERARQMAFLPRPDDDPEAFSARMRTYAAETRPVADYMAGRGVPVRRVDASLPEDAIREAISNAVDLARGAGPAWPAFRLAS